MKNKTLLAASLALMMALPMQAQMFFGKPKEVSDSAYLAQAQTPPMGWNSWNKFGCNVSQKLIMDMADKMVETGYFANEVNIHANEYVIRDLWKHKDIGTTAQNTKATIPAHGVLMVRLSKKTKQLESKKVATGVPVAIFTLQFKRGWKKS